MTEGRNCPECGQRMAFTPNGSALQCDHCGFRRELTKPSPGDVAELERLIRYAHSTAPDDADHSLEASRGWESWLTLGVTAAKAGDADEAYFYLSQVLLHPLVDDRARKEAWLALSMAYSDPAEKRRCLENVLAIDFYEPRARRDLAILDGQLDRQEIVDPDTLEPISPDAPPETVKLERFSCPSCGGRMGYAPDRASLKCGFCGFHQMLSADGDRPDDREVGERDFVSALFTERAHRRPVRMRTFACTSCGVGFVLPPESLSLTCPYCDSVYVTEQTATRSLIPPDALIPFSLTPAAAHRQLERSLEHEGLLDARAEPLTGLYLPAWTFDVHGRLLWHGHSKPPSGAKSVLGSANSGALQRSWGETRRRPFARHEVVVDQAHLVVDDLVVPATTNLPASFADRLREYDLGRLVPYDLRFLADWPAEHYQITASDASLQARAAIAQSLRLKFEDKSLKWRGLQPRSQIVVESFRLILLPIWLGRFWNGNQSHRVMVNDQTGSVYAERISPTSSA